MTNPTPAMLAIFLLACTNPDVEVKDPSHDPNRIPRLVTSADGDIGVMVEGHNDFTWELHDALATDAGDDNVFFSPFSVTSALGMTLAGAEGTTETEMQGVLHVAGDEAVWHGALGALTRDLSGDLHRGYVLHTANRLFGQDGYPWKEDFLAVHKDDYGAPLEPWDFQSDPEGGRQRVNDWVADQTEDRILGLIPPGTVSDDTRLVLANAVYFLADWATAFDPDLTRDQPFHRVDGTTVTVPMMRLDLQPIEDHRIEAGFVTDATLLRLPYRDDEVSMVLVIPDAYDGLPAVEADLDGATWAQWTDSLYPADGVVGMPKLELEYEADLMPHLAALGMPSAFQGSTADFTGMADPVFDDGPLFINGAYHKAFVKIDEAGTEAAAATGVSGTSESAPMLIIADRPFLFVIQDDLTGAILFVGRVTDPG